MIGDYQRQLDATRLGPLAHPHPPRCHADNDVGKLSRPTVVGCTGRRQHDTALQRGWRHAGTREDGPEIDTVIAVELAQRDQSAVQIDRLIVALTPQHRKNALTFAERVDADDMAALGEEAQRVKQLCDLMAIRRMPKDRQPEGRLRDEHITCLRLEGSTGRISAPLVVAGDDDAAAAIVEQDLSTAENMAGRQQGGFFQAQDGRGTAISRN